MGCGFLQLLVVNFFPDQDAWSLAALFFLATSLCYAIFGASRMVWAMWRLSILFLLAAMLYIQIFLVRDGLREVMWGLVFGGLFFSPSLFLWFLLNQVPVTKAPEES